MTEEWRPIPGYDGYYDVSDIGRVRSWRALGRYPNRRAAEPLLMSPWLRPSDGYLAATLTRTGERSCPRLVHILVAETFFGPCPPGQEVRHLNGVPGDNRVRNLAYGTHSQNIHDVVAHGNHLWANKTHCPNQHPYDDANTRHTKAGRVCRICRRAANARYRARLRAEKEAV